MKYNGLKLIFYYIKGMHVDNFYTIIKGIKKNHKIQLFNYWHGDCLGIFETKQQFRSL